MGMSVYRLLGPAAVLSTLCGCSATLEAQESADLNAGGTSYLGQAVGAKLNRLFPGEVGTVWNVSRGNALASDWLQQTPLAATWGETSLRAAVSCDEDLPSCDPDFRLRACSTDAACGPEGRCVALAATVAHDGDAPRSLCIGHSEESLDVFYNTLVSAKSYVDLTSLTPPDGRYEAAVRNAVTRLSERANPPMVRMLFGDFPGAFFIPSRTRKALTRDVASDTKLRLVVGGYRAGLDSWNHSKIVAVDGVTVLSGGTNMWTAQYLEANPVRDASLLAHGDAAKDAHAYINLLWDYTCKSGTIAALGRGAQGGCLPAFRRSDAPPSARGDVTLIALGRLGKLGANPSTEALVALIDAAQSSLKLVQQDLGPVKRAGVLLGEWPFDILAALIRSTQRNVEVQLVLSNPGAVGGTPGVIGEAAATYANGWTASDVQDVMLNYASEHPELGSIESVKQALCKNFKVYSLRSSSAATWSNGKPPALHSKIVIADDRAFYLGSENLYRSELAEFGYLVDNARITRQLVDEYFGKIMHYSASTRLSHASCSQ
jgi:phosphatidylserine/phosphatidylglycerophosphate/cardiolipin synthase-like enzyme